MIYYALTPTDKKTLRTVAGFILAVSVIAGAVLMCYVSSR
jgi:hypothetical protein